jgi:hypothetical protein
VHLQHYLREDAIRSRISEESLAGISQSEERCGSHLLVHALLSDGLSGALMHLHTSPCLGVSCEKPSSLQPDKERVQYVSEGSMAVLQIATLSSGSAILFFHSQPAKCNKQSD